MDRKLAKNQMVENTQQQWPRALTTYAISLFLCISTGGASKIWHGKVFWMSTGERHFLMWFSRLSYRKKVFLLFHKMYPL